MILEVPSEPGFHDLTIFSPGRGTSAEGAPWRRDRLLSPPVLVLRLQACLPPQRTPEDTQARDTLDLDTPL